MGVLHSYFMNGNTRNVIRQGGTVEVYSTLTPLDAAAVFATAMKRHARETPAEDDWIRTGDIRQVVINAFADEASAADGVVVEECIDPDEPTTVIIASDDSLLADTALQIVTDIRAPYFRFRFTNGAVAQGVFALSVLARR